jgi:spoIIIJ-associated protein
MNEINETIAVKLIEEVLAKMNIACDNVALVTVGPSSLYLVSSSDSSLLIGNRGENLRALNYLVRRIVENRFGEEHGRSVTVDVNGYQKKRIEEVQNGARMLAERVRLFRSSVEMSPTSSYERMIVHALFAEDPDVMTESEGEGPHRHIVIKSRTKVFATTTSGSSVGLSGADFF